MSNHSWIESDDLMILFVHLFGIENSPLSKIEIAEKIGTSIGSVSYRLGNFKAIDGVGKATHFGKLSAMVYRKYSHLSMLELRGLAFK
ncbi:winged helix-turn-helix domain-containing protein [Photobacterium sanguinicancri]|uniref:Winged helix-turn-helix domain-containing protein n=1 Tax=Photobacterium sanguinicancri TaxID=875932 RepID=A0AAW7Y7T3_9GAMM|nr:winged helix-turn-helix domain-containing protein [Photobacterium sanguinicancri]MDO6542958.1 winged helix-turn-helix domain-containing protein [Photobacterium sanguinicancri]